MTAPKNKQTIGIVLSSVPKYSETFFKNKIKGLQDSGFKVMLFVEHQSKINLDFECKVRFAKTLNNNKLSSIVFSLKTLIKSLLLSPKPSFRLYKLNRKDGLSVQESVKRIILNHFILKEQLDWLHFGYGMLVMQRENVAAAMQAKMAVSFRGADLYLTPLKHPNCYTSLWRKNVKYHVLAKEMQDTLVTNYKISESKIQIITPAINTNLFSFKSIIKDTSNPLKLVTVARLHWKKGLEYTLEALSLLKAQGINFRYTIIGEGIERERLIFAAHQLNVLDRVTFTGQITQDEIKQYLKDSDIYLQYSIQEGFCNALIEAQAMGLLCIASNAEGLQENIINNETGWIVPKREPELLANKLIEVINLPLAKKQAIQRKAIDRVTQHFNLELQRALFVKFYTD